MTKYRNIANLLVITIAIGLVYMAKENYEHFGDVHDINVGKMKNAVTNSVTRNAITIGTGYGVPLGAMNVPPTLSWYRNYNPYYSLQTNPYAYVPGVNYQYPQGPASNLDQTPLVYPTQLYPKIPWYPSVGKPCGDGCGATGTCVDGVCKRNPTNKTVFGIDTTKLGQ